jgi:hypothetical protein
VRRSEQSHPASDNVTKRAGGDLNGEDRDSIMSVRTCRMPLFETNKTSAETHSVKPAELSNDRGKQGTSFTTGVGGVRPPEELQNEGSVIDASAYKKRKTKGRRLR